MIHSGRASIVSILFFFISIFEIPASTASSRLECQVTSEMWDDVGARGYSFRAYSNLARRADGEKCMQWIIRNDPGRTAVKVDWYYPQTSATTVIIQRSTLSGCYDNDLCDCNTTQCQIQVETSPLYSEPKPTETTIDFGLVLRGPHLEDNPHLTDGNVRARILPRLGTERLVPKTSPPEKSVLPDYTPKAFPPPENWNYADLMTQVSGFPSTLGGNVVSLDLTFISSAKEETKGRFFVSNQVFDNTESGNVILTSTLAAKSGKVSLQGGAVAVAWTALETLREPRLFAEQFSSFQLKELAEYSKQPREAKSVGISDETRVTVYYAGEIILEVAVPAYLPLKE